MAGSEIEAIDAHITRHIGPVKAVFHEIISDLVHIDVHMVEPTKERPFHTLVTSGMSDLPMSAPEDFPEHRFAELMLCLPPAWPLQNKDFEDEANYWPVRWLKMLARMPHEYQTWLWRHHTIPNGDPASPLAPGVPFIGVMLGDPTTVDEAFRELRVSEEKTIHFFSVLPLHPDEMELKLERGADELTERLRQEGCTELVNLGRKNVAGGGGSSWWNPFRRRRR